MCLEIYRLDPEKFISAPGVAFQAALKMTKVELDLLTGIDMLLTVEKGIREGIRNAIHRHAKPNSKYMQDSDENKESLYLNYWDVNNSYDWAMSQKLPTFNFEWVEDTSHFKEDFVKNYDEKVNEGISAKLMFNSQKSYMNFKVTFYFYEEERNLKKLKSLWLICMTKLNMLCI